MKLTEIKTENIFSKDKYFNACHASTILKHENKLLCAFFAGTEEKNDDVEIFLCVNENDKWSEPKRMTFFDGEPCWNPVLFEKDEIIFLFFKVGKKISRWRTYVMKSYDGGVSFSEPCELVEGDIGGRGPVKNKPILLSDGKIAAPASIESSIKWDAFIDYSADGGNTWQKSELMPFDHKTAKGKGVIQPTLWESDGKIYAFLRSTESRIYLARSSDLIHFDKFVQTDLPNNNSGIDCVKVHESVVLIFNPIEEDWGDRNIIAYTITDDNGETFSEPVIIEYDEDTDAEFSYPAIITDGEYVYVTYTSYRKTIRFRKFKIV